MTDVFNVGDLVAVFGTSRDFLRPYIRFRGKIVMRIHPRLFKVAPEHLVARAKTRKELLERSLRAVIDDLAHDYGSAEHREAVAAELALRLEAWEAADPQRAVAWAEEDARQKKIAAAMNQYLQKIFRRM